jgi:hypothetical protein
VFDNILVEAIKLVGWFGGLVGLASGIFLIYDRVARGQPIPFLVPTKLGVQLCLRNVTRETLIVDEFAMSRVGLVAVAQANDIRSTVKSIAHAWYTDADKRVFAILRPEELRQFPLHLLDGLDKAADSDSLIIACAWRNTRRPWPFPHHVKIKTTVRDVRELHNAGEQDRYSDDDAG